jgi:hypothetical protein
VPPFNMIKIIIGVILTLINTIWQMESDEYRASLGISKNDKFSFMKYLNSQKRDFA